MTREEAIAHGKDQLEVFGGEHREFIEMAIQALEQEPCEDAICREEARQFLYERIDRLNDELYDIFSKIIDDMYNELPSVTPQEPTTKIEESNFSQEQYKADLQCAYDCGKSVIDKIRERVELEKLGYPPSTGYYQAIMKVLQILDKYKAETEDT